MFDIFAFVPVAFYDWKKLAVFVIKYKQFCRRKQLKKNN